MLAQRRRDIRQYLRKPNELFRRVRDEHGQLHLSKRAAAYHPGQGVYRSSYKNARRLTATETNMAYNTSDHLRWQQLDFVVGIEVRLSGNHTCLGGDGKPHEFTDICDELAGKYPKTFKFTGWHPQCRCIAISILKTQEEIDADTQKILNGEPIDGGSVNTVVDVPQAFKDWCAENKERATTIYSVPYFIKDNVPFVSADLLKSYASRMPYETYEMYENAMRFNRKHANFTEGIKKNNKELSKSLPVVQGKIMNFTEADSKKINPDYGIKNANKLGFHNNCQTCTMAYELRRRGFDIEAKPNPVVKGFDNYRDFSKFCIDKGMKWTDRYISADGKKVNYTWSNTENVVNTVASKRAFIIGKVNDPGRYEIYCQWNKNSSHVFVVEKTQDGNLIWFDPQNGLRGKDVEKYVGKMKPYNIGVLRIDDKLINPKFAERFLKARKN